MEDWNKEEICREKASKNSTLDELVEIAITHLNPLCRINALEEIKRKLKEFELGEDEAINGLIRAYSENDSRVQKTIVNILRSYRNTTLGILQDIVDDRNESETNINIALRLQRIIEK